MINWILLSCIKGKTLGLQYIYISFIHYPCTLSEDKHETPSNLNNYFRLRVCLSFCQLVRSPISPSVCHTYKFHYHQRSRGQVRLLLSKAKPSYVYSILKPHSQSSKSPIRPLSREGKQSCIHTILKNITSSESVPSSYVCQHT